MARLSLRFTISALSALSVAVVTAITLSITLTASINALRNIGETHSNSLLLNARLQTEALFHRTVIVTETIRNITRSEPWGWPSDDPSVLAMYRNLFLEQFLACEGYCTVAAAFDDSTIVAINKYNDDMYSGYTLTGAPYSMGGLAYQQTQPLKIQRFAGYWANNTSPPSTDPVFNQSISVILFASSPNWQSIRSTFRAGAINYGGVASTPGAYDRYSVTLYAYPVTSTQPPSIYMATSVSIEIAAVQGFLKGLAGTPNTRSFAYDNGGFLIGTNMATPFQTTFPINISYVAPPGCSSTLKFYAITGVLLGVCRTHVTNYGSAPLAHLAAEQGTIFTPSTTVLTLTVGGDNYFAAVARVDLKYPGMGVWLALVMPEADVLGDVVTGRNTAIGVTAAVFLVATCATFAAIAVLLRPLTTIANRMMLAASLEDDGSDSGKELSAMSEVHDLQEAYYEMNEELNRIKSFVPKTALRKTVRDADDDPDLTASVSMSDNVSVASSSRRSKVRSAAAGHLEVGLAQQSVTVVSGNMDGFDAAVQATSRTTVIAHMAETVQMVHEAAAVSKGVVQSFHGDHFVVTFNAVAACASHARQGASMAHKLSQRAPGVGMKLALRAGVATGKCLVGNLGSQDAKAFNTIGAAFVQAGLLEKLTRQYGSACNVLATRRTCRDIATHLRYRYVDIVPLPHEATLIGVVLGASGTDSHATSGVEWLYVVGDAPSSLDDAINDAFTCLADERYEACVSMVTDQLSAIDVIDGVRCCLKERMQELAVPKPATVDD